MHIPEDKEENTMPEKTYTINCYRRDGGETEILEFLTREEAAENFPLYGDPISRELYWKVTLTKYDWTQRIETELDAMSF